MTVTKSIWISRPRNLAIRSYLASCQLKNNINIDYHRNGEEHFFNAMAHCFVALS